VILRLSDNSGAGGTTARRRHLGYRAARFGRRAARALSRRRARPLGSRPTPAALYQGARFSRRGGPFRTERAWRTADAYRARSTRWASRPSWRASEAALYSVSTSPAAASIAFQPASGRRDSAGRRARDGGVHRPSDRAGRHRGRVAETGIFRPARSGGGGIAATALARSPRSRRRRCASNDGRCVGQGRVLAGRCTPTCPPATPWGRSIDTCVESGLAGPMEPGPPRCRTASRGPPRREAQCTLSDSLPECPLHLGLRLRRRRWACRATGAYSSTWRITPGGPMAPRSMPTGAYWICANTRGEVLRYTPDGRLDRSLRVPVRKPTMCAFGGDRYETLVRDLDPAAAPRGPGRPALRGIGVPRCGPASRACPKPNSLLSSGDVPVDGKPGTLAFDSHARVCFNASRCKP
jgi:hypothetical protein